MRSILLVNDEPIVCKAIEGTLRQFGFCVEAVHSVEGAIAVARRSKFDAILLEFNVQSRRKVHLRTAGGLSLISRLCSAPNGAPVLMFTAMAGEPYKRAALEAGAVAFIRNTDGIAPLVARLRTISGRRAARTPREQS